MHKLREALHQYDPSTKRTDGPFDRWQRADFVEDLIAQTRNTAPEYVAQTLEMVEQLEHAVVKTAPVKRLHDILMLDRAPVNTEKKPTVHNRFQHSELLSHLSMTIGLRLQLPQQDVLAMMLAGWLHDSGHTAFAHAGEDALNDIFKKNPRFDHEQISHTHVDSTDIQEICTKLNINSQSVHDIIDEEGVLGTLQSACDTLSYLLLDLSETGRENLFTLEDAKHILETIQEVGIFDGEQMLVVSSIEPWQKLLDIRAMMYREVYHSFAARIADKALSLLLSHAADKHLIEESTIIQGHDRELVVTLHSFVYGPSSLPGGLSLPEDGPLFSLAMGQYPNIDWTQTVYNTQEEARAHTSNTAFIEPTHIVPRKKRLKLLITGTDIPVTLTAKEHQETEPMRWVVLEPVQKENSDTTNKENSDTTNLDT